MREVSRSPRGSTPVSSVSKRSGARSGSKLATVQGVVHEYAIAPAPSGLSTKPPTLAPTSGRMPPEPPAPTPTSHAPAHAPAHINNGHDEIVLRVLVAVEGNDSRNVTVDSAARQDPGPVAAVLLLLPERHPDRDVAAHRPVASTDDPRAAVGPHGHAAAADDLGRGGGHTAGAFRRRLSATLEVKLVARALSARSWSRRIDVGETLISGSSFVCGRVNRNARPKNGRTDESQSLVATDPSHDCGERLLTPTRLRAAPQTDGNVE